MCIKKKLYISCKHIEQINKKKPQQILKNTKANNKERKNTLDARKKQTYIIGRNGTHLGFTLHIVKTQSNPIKNIVEIQSKLS